MATDYRDFGKATIREVVAISTQLEQETKTEFIHMEMGVPGLKAAQGRCAMRK